MDMHGETFLSEQTIFSLEGTRLGSYVSESRSVKVLVPVPKELANLFLILSHLPWHVLLLEDNLTTSELVLQWPLEVCDHGKDGKLARRDICLPECRSEVLFDETGFAASWSNDSKSLGGGSAKRCKISLGSYNGKSRGLAGVSGLR